MIIFALKRFLFDKYDGDAYGKNVEVFKVKSLFNLTRKEL